MTKEKKLVVTYTRSSIGFGQKQRGTLRALGLRRLGDVAEHNDTDVIRGMVDKVSHLVQVEERSS